MSLTEITNVVAIIQTRRSSLRAAGINFRGIKTVQERSSGTNVNQTKP